MSTPKYFSYTKHFGRFLFREFKSLAKASLGYPLMTPPLGSGTLDLDDVILANELLRKKEEWFNLELVHEYQRQFALWNGSKYAFAFMGGRVALSACIYALGLQGDDEVILPGYTCVVVPNAFHFANIKIVYSDIELDTYGLDASLIEEKITPRTRAILLHHLYGLVCRDYEKIITIARRHGLYVIEDCAQSTGAFYKGRRVGNFGDVAIYSSEQSKVFNTIQGGMAVTNNSALGAKIQEFYSQACYPSVDLISKQLFNVVINYFAYKDKHRWLKGEWLKFIHSDKIIISTTKEEICGNKPSYYGCKIPAAIAALGVNQLRKIEAYNQKRREIAKRWDAWCDKRGYKKPLVMLDSNPVFLRYPVMVAPEMKQNIGWAQKELGVTLGVWFVSNVHPSNQLVGGCPNANKAVAECINFPTLLN